MLLPSTQEDEVVLTAESNLSNLSFTGGGPQLCFVLLELQAFDGVVLTSCCCLVSAGECPAGVAKANGKDLGADEVLLEQQVSPGSKLNPADTPSSFDPAGSWAAHMRRCSCAVWCAQHW